MSKQSTDQIKYIAKLSKLEFTDDQLNKFSEEFNSILDYLSQIKECDTTGIEFEHNTQDYNADIFREDIVKPGLQVDDILLNATHGRNKNGYIRTVSKKTIEE